FPSLSLKAHRPFARVPPNLVRSQTCRVRPPMDPTARLFLHGRDGHQGTAPSPLKMLCNLATVAQNCCLLPSRLGRRIDYINLLYSRASLPSDQTTGPTGWKRPRMGHSGVVSSPHLK